jgi:TonB family protein
MPGEQAMGWWETALWRTVIAAAVAAAPSAPRLKLGPLPAMPGPAVGSGEVLLEVSVDAAGRVAAIRTLRDSPPYTERLRAAVTGWQFEPARGAGGDALAASVLVAGSYRPASVLGPAPGDVPKDLASPGPGVVFPSKTSPAPYPPMARADASVLVELTVAPDGSAASRVVRGAPGFDGAALQAARGWRFGPSPAGGRAYVVFGFRRPASM